VRARPHRTGARRVHRPRFRRGATNIGFSPAEIRPGAPERRRSGDLGPLLHRSVGFPSVSEFLRNYLTVAIFGGLSVALLAGVLGLGSLIRPTRRQPGKYLNYESGVDPVGDTWSQSQIRYYIFALMFVMFDVEAVFVFPWATRLETYQVFGLVEMLVFIVILALGLVYAWRKGVLRWI
jgi:NADH-quinone oxidoreductase subunit A